MKPKILMYAVAVLLLTGCQSKVIDNSMITDPGGSIISYATDIQPIFNRSCAGSGCHVGDSVNGVNLANWTATTSSSGLQYGTAIIVAGNGSGSPLVDKLSSSPAQGSRMPLGAGPLSADDVNLIRTWIDEGALDN